MSDQQSDQQSDPQSCASCRHHTSIRRPKILGEAGYDSLLEFADEDEAVYTCRAPRGPYAGKQIGTDPIHCDTYAPPLPPPTAELDAMMARFAARPPRTP